MSLDASKPWLCYWILHALHLLQADPHLWHDRVISTLSHMQNLTSVSISPSSTASAFSAIFKAAHQPIVSSISIEIGGFAGGPGQMSHCAPTYAAVLALCTIGTPAAFECINRQALYRFFLFMKCSSSGGFAMHEGGEVDSRGTYTVLAIARLLNMLTPEVRVCVY